jgi:hypothetical protein
VKKQTQLVRHGEATPWENFSGTEEIVVNGPASLTDGQAVRTRPDGDGQVAHAGQRTP